ncbi:hypothetical protein FRC12_010179 [Ceratobasidium sp. 428]|nr:hypothetical protein FRC12_010179 [Ceratobasidium sp. 428]
MTKEKELRRQYCLRELQNVRALTVQRVHVQQSHEKHAHGVKAINKESQVQERLRTRLACCQTFYDLHCSRLLCLGMSESDASAFRALTDGDLKSLMVDIGKACVWSGSKDESGIFGGRRRYNGQHARPPLSSLLLTPERKTGSTRLAHIHLLGGEHIVFDSIGTFNG